MKNTTGYWIVSMTFARSWIFKMYKKHVEIRFLYFKQG